MDPQMRNMMEAQKIARLTQLEHEMAWDLERSRLAHQKLKDRFIVPVEHHRFVVKAFLSRHSVSTLRCPKPSKEFNDITIRPIVSSISRLKAMHSRAQLRIESRALEGMSESVEYRNGELKDPSSHSVIVNESGESPKPVRRESLLHDTIRQKQIDDAVSKNEERRRKKDARKSLWDALLASKPNDKYVNPEDLEVCLLL
jgi:hypothetical protein